MTTMLSQAAPRSSQDSAFNKALSDFLNNTKLSPEQRRRFALTQCADLKRSILDIQLKQGRERKTRNFNRLAGFLEAMEQFEEVIKIFSNSSQLVAFIWGPMKFLLSIASTFRDAFDALLETYKDIGESLPLLQQYETLFRSNPHMRRSLEVIYKDILVFHQKAINYFDQPMWKKLFDATWKNFRTRFSSTLADLSGHKSLLESQASLAQYEEFQRKQIIAETEFGMLRESDMYRRRIEVNNWLSAAFMNDVQNDKNTKKHPGTGNWLLEKNKFKTWFDKDCCSEPLLWINGIPGAGKTILASLVIEESRKIPDATVVFFYCKDSDMQRDSFIALARSMLSQLLTANRHLLPYLWKSASESGQSILNSEHMAKELLETSIGTVKNLYIIIDGVDECRRNEQRLIISWFKDVISSQPISPKPAVRCLFMSQDTAVPRKLLPRPATLKIDLKDNQQDLETFVSSQCKRIQVQFLISDETTSGIANKVCERAAGIFLLAMLITENLHEQPNLEDLLEEIREDRMPHDLNQAYARILERINQDAPGSHKRFVMEILAWLVCAKRKLTWRQIQGIVSIDIAKQNVKHQRRLVVDSKELCGSLVELNTSGTVELVHVTVKRYLEESQVIDTAQENFRIASLCLGYLSLPGLLLDTNAADVESFISEGYFAFLEYAVRFWVDHLESSLSDTPREMNRDFLETLEAFIDNHYSQLEEPDGHPIPKLTRKKWYQLGNHEFGEKFLQIIVAMQKQIGSYGDAAAKNDALDLPVVVDRIRKCLECRATLLSQDFEDLYGTHVFKCPRISCIYFFEGFADKTSRDQHVFKHDRPFRCSYDGCFGVSFGFASSRELEQHMATNHGISNAWGDEFPPESVVRDCLKVPNTQQQNIQEPYNDTRSHEVIEQALLDEALAFAVQPEEQEDESYLHHRRQQTRPATFQCELCPKAFTRAYNLKAHLRSHTGERPFVCQHCSSDFSRSGDCIRHEKTHKSKKRFICRGNLSTGGYWGCGKRCNRADQLGRHFRSEFGRLCCIAPHLKEESELRAQRVTTKAPADEYQSQGRDASSCNPSDPLDDPELSHLFEPSFLDFDAMEDVQR